jgi:hypothetical protein
MGKNIAIREGMSEIQTVSAIVHEITHAKIHHSVATIDAEGDAQAGYNSCLSALRLSKSYSPVRLETACEMALTKIRQIAI